MTEVAIIHRLSEVSRMLDAATREIAELDEAAVRAKSVYEVAYARAFLTSDGSNDVKKQSAVLRCEPEHLEVMLAEQKVRACMERIRTLRSQIEVGRSLNAAYRAEVNANLGT